MSSRISFGFIIAKPYCHSFSLMCLSNPKQRKQKGRHESSWEVFIALFYHGAQTNAGGMWIQHSRMQAQAFCVVFLGPCEKIHDENLRKQ